MQKLIGIPVSFKVKTFLGLETFYGIVADMIDSNVCLIITTEPISEKYVTFIDKTLVTEAKEPQRTNILKKLYPERIKKIARENVEYIQDFRNTKAVKNNKCKYTITMSKKKH